jgi:hypothetical protein
VVGCACSDGATARATFVPSTDGATFAKTVSCVDKRLSFLNPGDRNAAGEALPDPCIGIDCGGHGKCVPMNMTATCECEHGYIAEGLVDSNGKRSARCIKPSQSIPDAFYNRRPMPRDAVLPVGRDEVVPAPVATSDPQDPVPQGNTMAMAGSTAAPDAATAATTTGAMMDAGTTTVIAAHEPRDDGGCTLRPVPRRGADRSLLLLALGGLGLALARARRRH